MHIACAVAILYIAGVKRVIMKIQEWNRDETPRERMMAAGASGLSAVELLAILLRTGTSGMNVVETARELLHSADNSLLRLSGMSVETLQRIKGIGEGKALTVAAAFELGKRLGKEMSKGHDTIRNPQDAVNVLRRLYTTTEREECWCLFLKRSRALLGTMRISEGGESMTEINIKRIVGRALDLSAVAVILSHNHPGGDPRPSFQDIRLTKQLKQALAVFELSLTDHIILSESGWYSFSEEATE